MSIQLFACYPLNASITPAQCKANQKRGVFACDKCEGLGLPVQLQPNKETKDMARPAIKPMEGIKKGDKFTCPGCKKTRAYSSRGPCELCAKADRKKQVTVTEQPKEETSDHEWEQAGWKKKEILYAETEDAAWQPEELSDPAPVDSLPVYFGKVANVTGENVPFGVDPLVMANIRRTLAELEQHMVVDLSDVGFFEAMDYLQNIRRGMAREVAA